MMGISSSPTTGVHGPIDPVNSTTRSDVVPLTNLHAITPSTLSQQARRTPAHYSTRQKWRCIEVHAELARVRISCVEWKILGAKVSVKNYICFLRHRARAPLAQGTHR